MFLLLTPRNSAAGALLQEVTRPVRASGAPAWQNALNVDYLAKPFTLLRSLFTPEPDPTLVRRLMLAGYRKPAHADIYVGLRLAIPATLGILIALFARSNAIMYFIIGVGLGFFGLLLQLFQVLQKQAVGARAREEHPGVCDFELVVGFG